MYDNDSNDTTLIVIILQQNKGVRQGYGLSLVLFKLRLEYMTMEWNQQARQMEFILIGMDVSIVDFLLMVRP